VGPSCVGTLKKPNPPPPQKKPPKKRKKIKKKKKKGKKKEKKRKKKFFLKKLYGPQNEGFSRVRWDPWGNGDLVILTRLV
jgi:hypothetical protein